MIGKLGFRRIVVLAGVFLLVGCVTVPKPIEGNHPEQDLTQIQLAPENFRGLEARLGGKVLKVQNINKHTRLEIAAQPLDKSGAPMLSALSNGRIFADLPAMLEPTDFNDKYVTVLGAISGVVAGKINSVPYNYVLVNTTGFIRWDLRTRVDYNYMMMPSPWFYNSNYPYFGGYPSYYPNPFFAVPTQVQQSEYLAPNQ